MKGSANNTVYIVCGPTAVGKTSLAIELAKALKTEIISADSRQCFRELGIAVAKPSAEELASVPHHFINSHSIQDEMNAGIFEQYALEKTALILKEFGSAVMVGGTGLYIKSFCEGIDEMPSIDPLIRTDIAAAYEEKGLQWLQNEIAMQDPLFWQTAEKANPQRLMRALEFIRSTGTSISVFKTSVKKERPFKIIKIGLELPRAILNERINERVDQMLLKGLTQEAFSLINFRSNNALQTVGYRELFDAFDGKISEQEAIELIKQNTRHYAKRQMTWFRKDSEIKWFDAGTASVAQILKSEE